MTDLDSAEVLKELKDYITQSRIKFPDNARGFDSILGCAIDHAVRALEERYGATDVRYSRNPNGSYTAQSWLKSQAKYCWHDISNGNIPEHVPLMVAWIDIYNQPHADQIAIYQYGSWYWYEGSPEDSEQEVIITITHWRYLPEAPNENNTADPDMTPGTLIKKPGWYFVDLMRMDINKHITIELYADSQADAVCKAGKVFCRNPAIYKLKNPHNPRLVDTQPDLEPDQIIMKLE